MSKTMPKTLYCLQEGFNRPLKNSLDVQDRPIPHIAFDTKQAAIEFGIKDFLVKHYDPESIAVNDIEWEIKLKRNSPFLTKQMLSSKILYLFCITVRPSRKWTYIEETDMYGCIGNIDEIWSITRLELLYYFLERPLIIKHPRM